MYGRIICVQKPRYICRQKAKGEHQNKAELGSVLFSDTHPYLLVKRRQFAKQIAWAFHCILFTDCSMNAHIR